MALVVNLQKLFVCRQLKILLYKTILHVINKPFLLAISHFFSGLMDFFAHKAFFGKPNSSFNTQEWKWNRNLKTSNISRRCQT